MKRVIAFSSAADDLFYDAQRKRLYISCGEGFIDIVEQTSADTYKRIVRLPASTGARTSFFSPPLNLFFLAVPEQAPQGAEMKIFRLD